MRIQFSPDVSTVEFFIDRLLLIYTCAVIAPPSIRLQIGRLRIIFMTALIGRRQVVALHSLDEI